MDDGDSTGGAARPDGPDERAPGRRRRRAPRAARREAEPRAADDVGAGPELPAPRGHALAGRRTARREPARSQQAPLVPGPRPAEPVVPAQRTRR